MRRALLLSLLLLGSIALADEEGTGEFRKAWLAASKAEGASRVDEETKAIELLRGPGTVDAARVLVHLATDMSLHWKPHAHAVAVLRSMTAPAVATWVTEQANAVAAEPGERAVLCDVIATYPGPVAEKALVPLLKAREPVVHAAACDALACVPRAGVVAALVSALETTHELRAKGDLVHALKLLTHRSLEEAAEWRAFWDHEGVGFDFKPPVQEAPRHDDVPRTTSDGSGLYRTISSNRIVFVIDVSGSMGTVGEVQDATTKEKKERIRLSRLDYVKHELMAAIDQQLTPECQFNLIAFSSVATSWRTQLVPATEDDKKKAKEWVQALRPGGSTNTYAALEAAFENKSVDTIYLLSDGFPTSGPIRQKDALVAQVREWNSVRRVRIHTLSYLVGARGREVAEKPQARAFMQHLAEATGGTFRVFE
jgi:hypothetical protein